MPSPSSKLFCAKPRSEPLRASGARSDASSTSSPQPNAPTTSLPPDTIRIKLKMLYYYSRALRVVLLVVAEVRCHVEQEQSRALGSRAGGGCWADCPAVWARGAAPTRPGVSSGPAGPLGAEERLAPRRGGRRPHARAHAGGSRRGSLGGRR